MKYFLYISVLAFAALQACNECTVKVLPDLFAKAISISQKSGGFNSGDIATVLVSISNLIDVYNSCPTETAASTDYETELLHRTNSNSAWKVVGKANYMQPNIDPGGNGFNDAPQMKFNVPGDYYVTNITDALKKIAERSKTNNTSFSQPEVGVRSSALSGSNIEFITVKSTKEFEEKVQRKEEINYVEFLPKANLKSVQLFRFQ
jgi:hypothetical protein